MYPNVSSRVIQNTTWYTRDTSGYIKIHKYLCIQLITHRIAVGVRVDRLRKQQRCWYWSASAIVFYVMCYVMQDSGLRVRLSTSWTSACACWVRSGRGSVWLAPWSRWDYRNRGALACAVCLCSPHVETWWPRADWSGTGKGGLPIGSTLINLVGFTLKLYPSVSYVYPTCI